MRAHIYVLLLVSLSCAAAEPSVATVHRQDNLPVLRARRVQSSQNRTVTVTAYCNDNCKICCGIYASKRPRTASGTIPKAGKTIACNFLPFKTRVEILGQNYTVEDRTAKRYSNRIDIFMSSHEEARKFGKQTLVVNILTK